jgi:glycosyltransferase involved in cell wall biosynthesis
MEKVSAILPVYNGEREVLDAIKQIEDQSYENVEIIVVDDGSSDNTFDVVKNYIPRRNIKLIKTDHMGPSHARNVGAAVSDGEVLFFAEADCFYSKDYVKKAVDKLKSENSEAVCLTGAPFKEKSTIATECIEIENRIQHALLDSGKIKPFYAWVFKKKAFLSVGGFDENLFQAEDKDLFRRFMLKGYKVSLVAGINWWHKRDQTLAKMSKKWMKRGISRVSYAVKNRLISDIAKKLIPLILLFSGILFTLVVPAVGLTILAFLLLIFIIKSLIVAYSSWSFVEKKIVFLYYPLFIATRNLSSGAGYVIGLVSYFSRYVKKMIR